MKLNFWQWLGVILLIGGLVLYLYERREKNEPPKSPQSPALTSQPA
jgi:drug/metabolite transporter (DMT)-like permease